MTFVAKFVLKSNIFILIFRRIYSSQFNRNELLCNDSIKHFFRASTFAKPECDNVLQPEPRSGEGCNTLSYSGLS